MTRGDSPVTGETLITLLLISIFLLAGETEVWEEEGM